MNFRQYSRILLGMLLLSACSKAKLDQRSGNFPSKTLEPSSPVRLVNLGGFTDLAINGQKLTNFVLPYADGTRFPAPTPYFPATGQLGTTYSIPQEFIDGNDSATLQIVTPYQTGYGGYRDSSTTFGVKEDYYHPSDYYWIYSRTTANPMSYSFYDSLVIVPRAVSPATDPTHILVRLVNLSSAPDDAGMTGPMSLVYADGSPVNNITNNIPPGKWSDYVELPYGTYQLKVLTASQAQVSGSGVNMLGPITTENQFTVLMQGLGLTYAPVQTFQPGGVYTVAVSVSTGFQFPYGSGTLNNNYNAFHIITDISPAANITYARMQAVNAVPDASLTVLVDGSPLSGGLSYDSVSDYRVYVAGMHQVTLQDGSGKTLASKSFDLLGNTNFTIWAFPSGNGADLLLAQNNLSGNENDTYNADGSDGGANTLNTSFPFLIRFLNLCPDLPYVTFTQASGALFTDYYFSSALAAQNIPFGGQLSSASVPFPYVSSGTGGIASQIQVYQSQPSVVPGNWLSDIPSLTSQDFIRMPSLFYPGGLPPGEPGVYTVALTGRYGAEASSGKQAKLIIVKHIK